MNDEILSGELAKSCGVSADTIAVREELVAIVEEWDAQLAVTTEGEPAHLPEGIVNAEQRGRTTR